MEDELGLYTGTGYDEQGGFGAEDAFDEQEAYLPPDANCEEKSSSPLPLPVADAPPSSDVDSRLREHERRIAELQAELKQSNAALDRWRSAFKDVAEACGFALPPAREQDLASIVEAVQRVNASERQLQEEVGQLRKREAALQIQLAERSMDNVELRRELASTWQAADPSIIQLKQLLLDPSTNREFQRLKNEVEESQKEQRRLQDELEAVNFTQESKIGRQLMAKCRSLQEENEEIGREISEGKIHQLETQLAMAKEYAEDMRRTYLELEDHCTLLDEESEELQKEIFALQRKLRHFENKGHTPMFDRKPDGSFFTGKGIGRGMDRKRMLPLDKDGPPRPFIAGRKRMR